MILKWMFVVGVACIAAQVCAEETPVLKTMKDKVSYATGVDMVRSFQRQGVEVDKDLFLKGVRDGLSGGALLLTEDDLNVFLKMFRTEQKMKLAERKKQQAERKKQQAEMLRKQRDNTTTRP